MERWRAGCGKRPLPSVCPLSSPSTSRSRPTGPSTRRSRFSRSPAQSWSPSSTRQPQPRSSGDRVTCLYDPSRSTGPQLRAAFRTRIRTPVRCAHACPTASPRPGHMPPLQPACRSILGSPTPSTGHVAIARLGKQPPRARGVLSPSGCYFTRRAARARGAFAPYDRLRLTAGYSPFHIQAPPFAAARRDSSRSTCRLCKRRSSREALGAAATQRGTKQPGTVWRALRATARKPPPTS